MTGIAATGGAAARTLVDQLLEAAGSANRAAHFADGEYIPQMSRQFELRKAFTDSGRAAASLERLAPQIAMLDGGEDGLRLATLAREYIVSGQKALREGSAMQDDVLRGGTVVEDAIATGTAGIFFREAESKVRGIADIALIESMTPDEVFRGLASRP